MNLKTFALPIVAAAAVTLIGAAPSQAAMPAAGVAVSGPGDSPIVQVAKKKRMPPRETRQQELDRSINDRTVPSRYRRDVPREYQQYIPFERR